MRERREGVRNPVEVETAGRRERDGNLACREGEVKVVRVSDATCNKDGTANLVNAKK